MVIQGQQSPVGFFLLSNAARVWCPPPISENIGTRKFVTAFYFIFFHFENSGHCLLNQSHGCKGQLFHASELIRALNGAILSQGRVCYTTILGAHSSLMPSRNGLANQPHSVFWEAAVSSGILPKIHSATLLECGARLSPGTTLHIRTYKVVRAVALLIMDIPSHNL